MKFVLSCAGPLSLDLDGIELFFKTIFDAQPGRYDSTVIDVPWRTVTEKPKLKIGVLPEHQIFPLHPPVKRTLLAAIQKLEAQGHEIIYLKQDECKMLENSEVAWNIFGLDQSARNHVISAGEPVVPAMHVLQKQGEQLRQAAQSSLPDMSALDRLGKLAVLNTRRAELRETFRKTWVKHDLDIILAPPAQSTAVAHDQFGLPPYTGFLNTLDVSVSLTGGSCRC